MLNCKINSDLDFLDKLSKNYPWIPNSLSIRPTESNIEKKISLLNQIQDDWVETKDYIFHTIFGEKYYFNYDGKKFVQPTNFEFNIKWSFQPSMFKYNLTNPDTNHWILWNSEQDLNWEYPEEKINHIITIKLTQHLTPNVPFQFVWYKNPKPTIPEFYHVQVFWICN